MRRKSSRTGEGNWRTFAFFDQSSSCTSYILLNIIIKNVKLTSVNSNILSVSKKLPVSKFPYFGKHIIQLYCYFYVLVSGQRQAGLER